MSDLYLGALLVIGVMTLIFFGPELGKLLSRKVIRSRRMMLSRRHLRKHLRVRTRRTLVLGSPLHN